MGDFNPRDFRRRIIGVVDVGKCDEEFYTTTEERTVSTGESIGKKFDVESDDLVKLVDRIGIIISGEKNAQHYGSTD